MNRSLIRRNQLDSDVQDLILETIDRGYANIVYTTGNQNISGNKNFIAPNRITVSGSSTPFVVFGHTLINHNGGPGYNTLESMEVFESGNSGTYLKVNNPSTGINSRAGIYLASPGNNVYAFTTPNNQGYQFQLSGDEFTNFHVQNTGTRRLLISGNRVLIGNKNNTSDGAVLQVPNGITFPATAALCNDPNTLDDYEEGSWTPILRNNATTQPTYLYNSNGTNGYYTRIGNTVFVRGKINVTGSTSNLSIISAQELRISGLPYTSFVPPNGNGESSANFSFWSLASGVFDLPSFVLHGTKEIVIGKVTGLSTSPPKLVVNDIRGATSTGFVGVFSATYLTSEAI